MSYDKKELVIVSAAEYKASHEIYMQIKNDMCGPLRKRIKDGLASIVGRKKDPLAHSRAMAAWLVDKGYIQKPDWNINIPLQLEHITTDDLAEAYYNLSTGSIPDSKEFDEDNPF